jgi:hypothetical protein
MLAASGFADFSAGFAEYLRVAFPGARIILIALSSSLRRNALARLAARGVAHRPNLYRLSAQIAFLTIFAAVCASS